MKNKNDLTPHKKYMRDIYSKYWVNARENIYGFPDYDKNLINLIVNKLNSGKILEVAIGTGYPFSDTLQKKGYDVYGIDISHILIEKCIKLNSKIICKVCDAENLPYEKSTFNITFCFHSTWYFENLEKVILEMIRVTKSNGFIIFDIQNLNNSIISKSNKKNIIRYKYRFLFYPLLLAYNIYKKIIAKDDIIKWDLNNCQFPSKPEVLYSLFNKHNIKFQVLAREKDDSLRKLNGEKAFEDYLRLIFIIQL